VADLDVALVDALEPHRPLDLDDAVVEVDQHHAVGDDALAADDDVLERGDRALLAEHGLGADLRDPLVDAQLAAVADPAPAAEPQLRVAADLELHARADEAQPVGLQPAAPAQLEPGPAERQERVLRREHPVAPGEPQEGGRAAVRRHRRAAHDRGLGWLGDGDHLSWEA
jgi:hypothetical protein